MIRKHPYTPALIYFKKIFHFLTFQTSKLPKTVAKKTKNMTSFECFVRSADFLPYVMTALVVDCPTCLIRMHFRYFGINIRNTEEGTSNFALCLSTRSPSLLYQGSSKMLCPGKCHAGAFPEAARPFKTQTLN